MNLANIKCADEFRSRATYFKLLHNTVATIIQVRQELTSIIFYVADYSAQTANQARN